MKSKLFLAVLTVIAALAATVVPASAQSPAYAVCGVGQVQDPANPYYCIPDGSGGGGTKKKATKRVTLKVKPKKDKSAPIRYTASGKIVRPSGVSKAAGCKGTVRVTVKKGKKVVAKKTAKVKKSCKYSTKVKVKSNKLDRKGKLKVRAKFNGNKRLKAKKSKTVKVSYRK